MGLAQKRIVEAYKTEAFPAWKKELDAVVGKSIPMDVKWETMQSEDYDKKDDYYEWYGKVYFQPLLAAMKSICSDDMGKKAAQESIKQIVIDGTDGISGRKSTFDGGTLTINHKFASNVDDVSDREEAWQKLLESKL